MNKKGEVRKKQSKEHLEISIKCKCGIKQLLVERLREEMS